MTQRIVTADERHWRMFEPDHRTISSQTYPWQGEDGKASLGVCKDSNGLHIEVSDMRSKKEKTVSICLRPATVRSLVEWLNAHAQEPAANGGDERVAAQLQETAA